MSSTAEQRGGGHWIDRVADQVEKFVSQTKGDGAKIVCASGISPSGTIHLGNLRELMTVHLVSEELRLRGRSVEHIHSWDDFDRFRKVPSGVDDSYALQIGKPICDIPDPGGEFDSYATRHIVEFERAMDQLGIKPRYIRQSQAYRRGDYNEQIKIAMRNRSRIFDILSKYQTLEREGQESVESRRESYYPLRCYCAKCGTDSPKITGYDDATAVVSYDCGKCGHKDSFKLEGPINAKLVWKVDWPMRWKYEGVDFEPGGEDHAAPGSSYTVGKPIVADVFGGKAPTFIMYAFVGMGGRTKISSSAGTNATPQNALDIMEPCMVRWLYIRRQVSQKFEIDFGQQVLRLYDEWDSFCKNCESGKANEADKRSFTRAITSSQGSVARTPLPVSFRLLSSATDITEGNTEQILNIVAHHLPPGTSDRGSLAAKIEPRLSCATRWSTEYVPEEERTHVQHAFNADIYATLNEQTHRGLAMLLEKLDENWSLEGLTHLVYGVPKQLIGLPMDAPPSEEMKPVQREFFKAIYQLMVKSDTGPRLPTLFLSIGKDRVRQLLSETDGGYVTVAESNDIISQIESLAKEANESLSRASDSAAMSAWHQEYLSSKGKVATLLKGVGAIKEIEAKKAAGKAGNELKQSLKTAFDEQQDRIKSGELEKKLSAETVDVTLPGRPVSIGKIHPSTATLREICGVFEHMGFEQFDSPEVETDEYNFGLLNMPPDHPARDMWDTFYTTTPGLILRTHTSPGQIHAMRARAPEPVRIISAGKSYRFEMVSARSEMMFNMIEGLAVGKNITFGDLKGTLMNAVDMFFGVGRKLRFRKSYFPFTEPSVEVDITCTLCNGSGCSVCKHSGWLEVLGAGMVHPTVLKNGGYDPSIFTGFAFGMGPERLTMLKYRIDDIRYFFSNDVRFLKQF